MVGARLPLVEALETATRQCESDRLRGILTDVVRRVEGGGRLSDALARHGSVFSGVYAPLVRAGEAAGALDAVLLRLADHLERGHELRRRVRLALAYPVLVLTITAAATAFLLTVVVPTFAEMFADFDAELPGPTRLVIATSEGIRQAFPFLVLAALGLGIGVRYAVRSARGRRVWDGFKLRVPLLGSLYRKALTARFCHTLGTLLESGVPLVEALEITAQAAGNQEVERAVLEMRRRVVRGSRLAAPLSKAAVFPPMVVQMVAVGEETARLGEVLAHTAKHYEAEVDAAVDALTSLVEPVLIVVLGLVVGAVLVAIYLPMFEMSTVVQ